MLDHLTHTYLASARCNGERLALMARPDRNFWAVAQGVGSHEDADWAATTVMQHIEQALDDEHTSTIEQFRSGINKANQIILRARGNGAKPPQTAMAAINFCDGQAFGHWIGNCRIYRLRQDQLTQLSEDHDLATEIESRQGKSLDVDARKSLSRVLTRAIGSVSAPEPSRFVERVQLHDRYLVCGAGLSKTLDDIDIERQLSKGCPREALDRLQGLHLSRGGIPNFGAIVIDAPF